MKLTKTQKGKSMENRKKNKLREFLAFALGFGILCLGIMMLNEVKVNAAEQTVNVNNGDSLTIQVHPGDTGTIVPNLATIDTPSDDNWYDDFGDDWYDSWNYNQIDVLSNDSYGTTVDNPTDNSTDDPAIGTGSQEIKFEYSVEDYEELPIVTVDESGKYQILENFGREYVSVIGRDSQERTVFRATVIFIVRVDMTDVTLQKTNLIAYLIPSYYNGDYVSYDSAQIDVKLNSKTVLSDDMYGIDLESKVSSKNVGVYATLSDNVLHLTLSGQKKCTVTVTVTIAEKKFKIKISLKPVKISTNSVLLEKGKTKQLKVSNWPGKLKWSSSNKNIASVSKSGVVKGKKIGNIVITAKIGDKQVGCAVSVTTSKLKKVCRRGTYIGTHWTYSQPRRTESGYYDCSALVWKAYKECAGLDFGSAFYPGTTVTESAWCKAKGRMIKGGYTYKKVKKMQLNPGDIVFKSEDMKNPYGTTYHVEMFTGYACTGYDSKGKPEVTSLWAARGAGYGAIDGSLLGRPMK